MVRITLLLFIVFLPFALTSQTIPSERTAKAYLEQKGEVYYFFSKPEREVFSEIINIVSVDNIAGEKVYAYANTAEFQQFLEYNISYTVLEHPGDVDFDLNMMTWEELSQRDLTESWDFYPTYEAYVDLMYHFEAEFPELVKIVNIGQTVLGRDLLFAKISPQVEEQRPVPQFMYTSTMHGDETAGFIISLRLIHYLLTNYGEVDEITALMDNVEIWICPNENPDGTYRDDNSSVNGATRGNWNGVDLNRNYPNPVSDPTTAQQPETAAMINFADTMNFIMSANMHGGIELVNFPFDSWTSNTNAHADHDWWEFVMYEYVDTAHQYSPPGYMTGQGDGVTHGGDWYVIYGSRQDYLNYYLSCREFTLELSKEKLLDPEQLPAHWEYNYRSLLNYIRQATYGVHGLVYDNETGQPLSAVVSIPGHDSNNSEINTSMTFGNYNRPIQEGTYNFYYSSFGYPGLLINDVEVTNYNATYLNVALGEGVSDQVVEVTISKEGSGKIFPFEGTQMFNNNSNIFLYAEPDEYWAFEKWVAGEDSFYDQETIYELNNDIQIYAHFTPVPGIVVNPGELEFSTGIIGKTYVKELIVKNAGNETLEVSSVSLEGDDVFFLDLPVKFSHLTIEPGEEEVVEVFFEPQEEREYSATLFIENNDPENPEVEIPVMGKGKFDGAIIELSDDLLSFGEVLLDESDEKTFTIFNNGNITLTIEEIVIDSESFVIYGNFPIDVEPDDYLDFTASFSPQTIGVFTEVAIIISNAVNDPEFELMLEGTGVDPSFVSEHSARKLSYEVYPNPVQQSTQVVMDVYSGGSFSIIIYNIKGRMIGNIFEGHLDAGKYNFSLSSLYEFLEPGIYFVSICDGKSRYHEKIIKH